MKIKFITFEKAGNREIGSAGSTRIRARWVWEHWDEASEWEVGCKADVLIFQKVYWDMMMDEFDGIKILDLTDPDWLERKDFMKYVDKVDAVTTSTQPLADYVEKFRGTLNNKKVIIECVPDRIDFNEVKRLKHKHSRGIKQLVWFGYSHNFHYVESALEKLDELNLNLTVISDTQVSIKKNLKNLSLLWLKYAQYNIHQRLAEFDAGLFPERVKLDGSPKDYKAGFKSNNKRILCYALGLPIISVPQDFDRLHSMESREKEADKNWNIAIKDYPVHKSVEQYKDIIKRIQDVKKR